MSRRAMAEPVAHPMSRSGVVFDWAPPEHLEAPALPSRGKQDFRLAFRVGWVRQIGERVYDVASTPDQGTIDERTDAITQM